MEFQLSFSNPKRWCYESGELNMPANLEKSAVITGLEKVSFIPIPKKDNAKECSSYHITALISHASKVILKIMQARFQQYMNWELPNIQARFRIGKRSRDQIANICWIIQKARNSRETSTSASLTTLKLLTLWITTNCGKFLKRSPNLPLEKPVCNS